MTLETEDNPTAEEGHVTYIAGVMKYNEEFLRKNTEEPYDEVVKLINDAINYIPPSNEKKNKEDYVKCSMVFYLYHILLPSSYAIQTNLLAGNLPACFMQLRLMLESLAKCYLADSKHSDQASFQKKLELLDSKSGKKKTISEQMIQLGKEIGLKNENDFVNLWRELSNEWIHTKGFVKRISQTENSTRPSWAFIIPTKYAGDDLRDIAELGGCTSRFRGLLKATIASYKQKLNSEGV